MSAEYTKPFGNPIKDFQRHLAGNGSLKSAYWRYGVVRGAIWPRVPWLFQLSGYCIEREAENPRLVQAFLKTERDEALTAEEALLMDQLVSATLRLWENTWYQSQKGLFDPDEIEAEVVVWRKSMREKACEEHWADRRMSYSREFREVIDGFLESSG